MASKSFLKMASESIGAPGFKEQVAVSMQSFSKKVAFGKTFVDDMEAGKVRLGFFRYKQIQQTEHLLMDFEAAWLKRGGRTEWACSAEELARLILKISGVKDGENLNFVNNPKWKQSRLGPLLKVEKCVLKRYTRASAKEPVLLCPDWGIASNGSILVDLNDWTIMNDENLILILSPYRILQDFALVELLTGMKGIGKNGMPASGNLTILKPGINKHVIFYDFESFEIVSDPDRRSIMHCIECQACIDACPVNQWIPEQAWDSAFSGPLAALVLQAENETNQYDMSNACTSCSACNEVCPVNIPLSGYMKRNVLKYYEVNPDLRNEKIPMYLWKNAMAKRSALERGGPKIKGIMLKQFLRKTWGLGKEIPVPAAKSFNQLWKERRGY